MYLKTFLMLCLTLLPGVKLAASDYNIFVDISNNTGIEDGSENNPFNTIGEAIILAQNNEPENRKIYVANGEYLENIELTDGIEIFGENKSDTIIDGSDDNTTVKMNNKTSLENIKIYKGKIGISIEKNSKVEINQVKIQKTKKIGINLEESSKKRLVTIKNCEIYEGDGKGIYIKKKNYAKIYDNEIYDNEEEGIDIRSSAKGSVRDNKIYKNGESGVEFIIERSKMDIDKNKIYKNSASGISFQAYVGGLSAYSNNSTEKNKISYNKKYGLECATPSNLKTNKSVSWSQSITPKNNTILNNKMGIFSDNCHFKAY